jgi:eukaryotic-like serine/threonine-protein kinase
MKEDSNRGRPTRARWYEDLVRQGPARVVFEAPAAPQHQPDARLPERGPAARSGLRRSARPPLAPRASKAQALEIGLVIDERYEIEGLIAEGGIGMVYECRHLVTGERLAMKVIRPAHCSTPDLKERLRIEARAASSIGNDHVVDVSDFGTLPNGSPYLVMELLEGTTLSELLRAHGRLPPQRVVSLALQIADGVGAAHDAGVVHRDLKPDNIFIQCRDGEDFVKVLDFGLAKLSGPGSVKLTGPGHVLGTPYYISPEQARGMPVDARVDVYALGVILYELVSGRVPFVGGNAMMVLAQHANNVPPALSTIVPQLLVAPALEAIITKCLLKRPEHRFATMRALRAALESLS